MPTMQSHDYVPGFSGMRFNDAGECEIHGSCAPNTVEPQLITITAGEWPDNELPANAVAYHAFIGAELDKIPCEYRGSAELSTTDESYDPDCTDIRTRLSYTRPETAAEIADRLAARRSARSLMLLSDRFEVRAGGHVMLVMAVEPPFVLHADVCHINGRVITDRQSDR
ncbi:hypothetical protein BFW91_01130 [Pseudomonas fluorescens]|uniref:hypothetical protein n=1 Tax=Pseudomonas fluorescens TaxID=294 RepID=UPI00099BE6A1|nr:hypothetical protein [Pseudomonas fluorescens]OPB16717.1 hypothetical protein BFW91_01130 [Pseudomonas fluorescens]